MALQTKSWANLPSVSFKNLEELDLSDSDEMSDNDVVKILESCPNLTKIKLHKAYSTIPIMDKLIENCKKITSVSLDLSFSIDNQNIISNEEITSFINNYNNLITAINLSYTGVTNTEIIALATHCKNITSIDLSYCEGISDADIMFLASNCKKITAISLPSTISDNGIIAFSNGCDNLTEINLSSGRITNQTIIALVQKHKNLSSIKLNCDNFTDAAVIALADNCKEIISLDLDNLRVSDQTIMHLAEKQKKIRHLTLVHNQGGPRAEEVANNPITDAAINSILDNCKEIISISLQGITMTSQTMKRIATTYPNLESINFAEDAAPIDSSIDDFLLHCKKLKSVSLQCNNTVSNSVVQKILTGPNEIRSLDLLWCSQINDTAFTTLSPALKSKLSTLQLSCSGISDPAIAVIAAHCPQLRQLAIFRTRITDSSIDTISQNLPKLTVLGINGCANVTDEAVARFIERRPDIHLSDGGRDEPFEDDINPINDNQDDD